MRNMVRVSILAAMSLTVVGCSGSNGGLPTMGKALAGAGLQEYWKLDLSELLDEGEALAGLKLLDEKIYCITSANRVIAIDAASGATKWQRRIAGPYDKIMGITHVDKMVITPRPIGVSEILGLKQSRNTVQFNAVIINTMSDVLVMDRDSDDGKVYRKMPLRFSANSGAASDGQNVYLGSTSGTFHALALAEALPTWGMSTNGMISAPLRCFGGNIYVASEDQNLYCANAGRKGRLAWKQRLEGAVTAAFHVDARGCFVPSLDGRLYAFDPQSVTPLWGPFICDGPLTSDVQVGENTVFQYADNDGLYAINIANGRQRWHSKEGRRVLAVAEGNVYVLSGDNVLLTVDEILGEVKAKVPMKCLDLFADNVSATAIYAATREGVLYCIRRVRASRLTAEMLNRQK